MVYAVLSSVKSGEFVPREFSSARDAERYANIQRKSGFHPTIWKQIGDKWQRIK